MEIKSQMIREKIVNILSDRFLAFPHNATTGLQITEENILQETNRNKPL